MKRAKPSDLKILNLSKEFGITEQNSEHGVFRREDNTFLSFDNVPLPDGSGHDVRVNIASVIPVDLSTAKDYLDAVDDYENLSLNDHTKELDICRRLYKFEGAVGTAIDTLIDLAITPGFVTDCPDPNLKELLGFWLENVNGLDETLLGGSPDKVKKAQAELAPKEAGIRRVFENVLLEYLVTGDAVITEFWAQVPLELSAGKKTFKLPSNLNVHQVEYLVISDKLLPMGREVIYLKLPDNFVGMVKSPGNDSEAALIKDNLSPYIVSAIKSGVTEIPLPAILTTHFKRRGEGNAYGTSYLRKAFTAVAAKRRIQALDHATIAGMIQRLTIIMVGHDDPDSPYHIPKPGRVALLKSVLKTPEASKMLIWGGPDLIVKDIGPEGKVLGFDGRFSEADDSISMALGVPRLLIDGASSGTSSRDFSVFLSTISKLEALRSMLVLWINREFRAIALSNGFQNIFPRYELSPIKLRDENSIKTQAVKAYEIGLMGRRDALLDQGYDPDRVVARQLQEVSEGLNEKIPPPRVSYSPDPNAAGGQPNSGTPSVVKKDNGRPPGLTETKPRKQQASSDLAETYWREMLLSQYESLKTLVLISQNLFEAQTSIVAGFVKMERVIGAMIVAELEMAVGQSGAREWEHSILGWNNGYLISFRNQMVAGLPKERESWAAYLDSFNDGVGMYHTECLAKVGAVSRISALEAQGYYNFSIKAGERSCAICRSHAGINYNKQSLFNAYPCHPGCTCQVEGAKD